MPDIPPFTARLQRLGLKPSDLWFLPCYALAFFLLHRAARPERGGVFFAVVSGRGVAAGGAVAARRAFRHLADAGRDCGELVFGQFFSAWRGADC
jgi:hypothetical protein